MSNLCSLAWCRKPISNKKKSKRFPSDRPSQLAWLDALDAGAWFSIPPETLSTGLVLCECHFDAEGNIQRRYNSDSVPEYPEYNPASVKLEPRYSDDESEENEDFEPDRFDDHHARDSDENYSPPTTSRKSKRNPPNVKLVRINIVHKRKAENEGPQRSRPCPKSKRAKRQGQKKAPNNQPDEDATGIQDNGDDLNDWPKFNVKVDNSGSEIKKRNSLSLEKKMDVLKMLDEGLKQIQIAKQLNISKTTISGIVNSRTKIEKAYQSGSRNMKKLRTKKFPNVNQEETVEPEPTDLNTNPEEDDDFNEPTDPNLNGDSELGQEFMNAVERLSEPTSGPDQMAKPVQIKRDPDDNNPKKRQSVTLMQKMEVLRMLDKGMKQIHVAKQMNLQKSTVSTIIHSRTKIEQAYNSGAPLRKRIIRKAQFADVNEAVYQWYEKVRTQNLFVNSRVLLQMAENIANGLGHTDFSPSPNWLSRFKEHYNVRFSSTPVKPRKKSKAIKSKIENTEENCGGDDGGDDGDGGDDLEMETITSEDENTWLKKDWLRNNWAESRIKNPKTQEAYSERDTFFIEELGILYRITPKQAWQFRRNVDSSLDNFSILEERLTVLICSNANGSEKRRLTVIGPALVGIPGNLPADYIATNDPSNWITKKAFKRWIVKWNGELELKNRKIVLISNSSPIHIGAVRSRKMDNIKMVNIPTRLLASLHPVNYGISRSFKSRYRRLLLERLVKSRGDRPITYLDSIFMLSTAWNELSSNLIRAGFHKAGYFSSSDLVNYSEEEFDCSGLIAEAAELDLAVAPSKYPFSDYVEIDNSLCAIECTVLGGSEAVCSEQDAPGNNADDNLGDGDDNDILDNDDQNNVDFVPLQCNLTALDAQTALENMRLFAMSRKSCPQEVHNALSTFESFLLGHN